MDNKTETAVVFVAIIVASVAVIVTLWRCGKRSKHEEVFVSEHETIK